GRGRKWLAKQSAPIWRELLRIPMAPLPSRMFVSPESRHRRLLCKERRTSLGVHFPAGYRQRMLALLKAARTSYRPAILAGAAIALVLTSGCGGSRNKKDTSYVARDVETLYAAAKDRLDRGSVRQAAALFDEVERQHPYSPWARRAQLMSAFSYYAARSYDQA